jgi:hypothetical protein
MKFLFNKKKRTVETADPGKERIAKGIAGFIGKAQRKWADWMQRKSERLSIKGKWFTLFLFCAFTVAVSTYLIITSIWSDAQLSFSVAHIKTAVQLKHYSNESSGISKSDYEKIHRFKFYMDSLARSPTGSKEYEEFRQDHPGLMDSIRTVERLYQSQFKQ